MMSNREPQEINLRTLERAMSQVLHRAYDFDRCQINPRMQEHDCREKFEALMVDLRGLGIEALRACDHMTRAAKVPSLKLDLDFLDAKERIVCDEQLLGENPRQYIDPVTGCALWYSEGRV